ncbi:Uncharacterised protein [uncultured archaeon]|nr:Uncharacterised protein [uncultured archaeon]
MNTTLLKKFKEIQSPAVKALVKDAFSKLMDDKLLISKNSPGQKEAIGGQKKSFLAYLEKMVLTDKQIKAAEYSYVYVYSPKTGKYVGIGNDSKNSG